MSPRKVLAVIVAAASACLWSVVPGSAATAEPQADTALLESSTPIPDPSFGVGRRVETFVDPTRPTPADPSRDLPEEPDRTLETTLLYPTHGDPDGPVEDSAPAAREQSPLIVFAHGFTANGPAYGSLLEPLVRQGYVVALPTFPRTSGSGAMFSDYVNQPGDVSLIIDEVLRLNKDTGSWLHEVVHPHRVGAGGHSLGAITTFGAVYNSCCTDPRIDAAVPVSGIAYPFPEGEPTWYPTPLLLVHGVKDQVVPIGASDTAFNDATGHSYYLKLSEADHISLTFGEHGELTQLAMLAFFDGKLKGPKQLLRKMDRIIARSGEGEWLTK